MLRFTDIFLSPNYHKQIREIIYLILSMFPFEWYIKRLLCHTIVTISMKLLRTLLLTGMCQVNPNVKKCPLKSSRWCSKDLQLPIRQSRLLKETYNYHVFHQLNTLMSRSTFYLRYVNTFPLTYTVEDVFLYKVATFYNKSRMGTLRQ